MAITSAFQADDAGSIPAARSSLHAKAHSCEWAFVVCFDAGDSASSATLKGAEMEKAPSAPFQLGRREDYSCSSSPQKR